MSDFVPTPYVGSARRPAPDVEALRARIPGWGVDLDPADRPSYPREWAEPAETGAHWRVPERQPEHSPRERSVEHGMLPPVFGTAQPLRGLSGLLRRQAYRRYSEGRTAHWLLLIGADRVDVVENVARSMVSGRPDNPLVETGTRTELDQGATRWTLAGPRADRGHHALDPLVVAGPWLVGGWVAWRLGRRALRRS